MSEKLGTTLYVAMAVRDNLTVSVMGVDQKLDLDYEEGMVGMLPVYRTYAEAKEANPDYEVITVKVKTIKPNPPCKG